MCKAVFHDVGLGSVLDGGGGPRAADRLYYPTAPQAVAAQTTTAGSRT